MPRIRPGGVPRTRHRQVDAVHGGEIAERLAQTVGLQGEVHDAISLVLLRLAQLKVQVNGQTGHRRFRPTVGAC
jgi:hypothetical protein